MTPEGVQLGLARHGCGCSPVAVDMSDESVITIEIRGHERAALEAAHRISALFLSSGPCRLRRTPGEEIVEVRVYADVRRRPDAGGYSAPGDAASAAGSGSEYVMGD